MFFCKKPLFKCLFVFIQFPELFTVLELQPVFAIYGIVFVDEISTRGDARKVLYDCEHLRSGDCFQPFYESLSEKGLCPICDFSRNRVCVIGDVHRAVRIGTH